MRSASFFRRVFFVAALLPAVILVIEALLLESARHDARRAERVAENAHLAAASIDLRLGKLLDLTRFCATSPELVSALDLDALGRSCGRYAAQLGAWVVVVEIGETHRQIVNTRPDAPAVLPVYPRTDEHPTLIGLENRSRQTGAPLMAEVFTGIIYPRGVVAAGQYLRLADGREAMLYVSIPAQALTEHLAQIAAEHAPVFGLIDPTRRVVARSVGIEQTMFIRIPFWLDTAIETRPEGALLDRPAPAEIGGTWDIGYHALSTAPGWVATAALPSALGSRAVTLLSLPTGLALLGSLLSGFLIWLFVERDRAARKVRLAELARHEAEEQNRDKSRLLASFAHDIRSPLISLIGSLEMIDETGNAQAGQVRTARGSAEALLQLVDDILELSFLGSGAFTLHPSPVDLRRLSEDLAAQIRGAADRKGLVLDLDLDPALPPAVEVDRLRLQQVLSNLLTNAVKYTEQGKVTLRVTAMRQGTGMVALTFAVSDTGVGLAAQDVPRILREFGRLDRSAEQREQGIGLGLAIVQRILRAMGTQLTVSGAPGQGATFAFRLTLPVAEGHVLDNEAQPLAGVVVVYVEDEPVIRHVTARRLGAAGARVIEAVDGADALRQLGTMTPDLLLLDLQMPGLDGAGVIRRLRVIAPDRTYPIFVLTSHISGPQAAEARLAGADVVFTKPVQVAPLAAAFRARRGDGGRHTPMIGLRASEVDTTLIDIENFRAAMDVGDITFASNVVSRFEETMWADLGALCNAIAADDLDRAGRLAHRCLGLCQVLGAQRLAQQVLSIERAAGAQDRAALARLQEGLFDLLGATVTQMWLALRDQQDSPQAAATAP